MKRLLMVSAVAALMAAMMVSAGPAMADTSNTNDLSNGVNFVQNGNNGFVVSSEANDDNLGDFFLLDNDGVFGILSDDSFGSDVLDNDGFLVSGLDQNSDSGDLETNFEVS